MSSMSSTTPFRGSARLRLHVLLAVAAGGALLTTLTPAVAEPVDPGDGAISAAESAVREGETDVAALAASISENQAEIDRLELEVGGLHEAVNKALVDLHDARARAEQARQDVVEARNLLDETQRRIDEEQATLDEISRAAYRRTAAPSVVSDAAGTSTTEDALDRQTYLRTTAEKQRGVIEGLDRLRAENANHESALRVARNLAEEREEEAVAAESAARTAIEENSRLIGERAAERERLVAQRDGAQAELDAARGHAAALADQRRQYEEFRAAEAARKQAEEEAAAAAEARRVAEEEAAARAAEAEQARAREAGETEGTADTTDITDTTDTADIADTAESAPAENPQSGQPEPGAAVSAEVTATEQEAERAQAEAEQRASDEQVAAAARDAAAAVAVSAAAAIIAQSQPDHSNLASPYPGISDEETEGGEIAAVQNPQAVETEGEMSGQDDPAGDPASTGSADSSQSTGRETETAPQGPAPVDTLGSVTERASEAVSGSREQLIETAIARAESQIGVPYAWGGGNASGPTRGIRDGGVGDSNGDYNKVGFDCSGLMVYAFAGAGVALPHYSGYQYQRGTKIDPGQMQRGDLIFYGPGGSQHVAIYLGDGMMLEAPNSGSVVKKSPVRWSGMSEHAVRLL